MHRMFLKASALLFLCVSAPAAAEDPPFVPVFEEDFPDPFVLEHEGRYFAYATNPAKARQNVQMATSPDMARWEHVRDPKDGKTLHDALPTLPAWAKKGRTWAPEVLKTQGGYILYFTARHDKTEQQCVGAATSASPLGPFVSTSAEPLICQHSLGGTIDASPFRDSDGQLYLYFKNDGNHPSARKPTEIFGQRLAPDGLSVVGEPVSLLKNDKEWEGHVVEAPTMVRTTAGYRMLFSANDFGWPDDLRLSPYAIGYALCSGPLGPCADAPENPILYSYSDKKLGCLSGPGHQTIFQAGGRTYVVFHAWRATSGCRRNDWERWMYVAPLSWRDGKPIIAPSVRAAK